MVDCGIKISNIKTIVFRDKIKKNETFSQPTFSNNAVGWKGDFNQSSITDFINNPFEGSFIFSLLNSYCLHSFPRDSINKYAIPFFAL